jgi:hypothetical protein
VDFATRYDFLKTLITRYDGFYNLAAVKGSLLLTSNVIFLAPALGEHGVWRSLVAAGGTIQALTAVAAMFSLISMAFAAFVIASTLVRPKATGGPASLAFTESVATIPLDEYRMGIADLSETEVIADLARLAHLLAANLSAKFRYVNISLAALIGAIVTAFAAVVLAPG